MLQLKKGNKYACVFGQSTNVFTFYSAIDAIVFAGDLVVVTTKYGAALAHITEGKVDEKIKVTQCIVGTIDASVYYDLRNEFFVSQEKKDDIVKNLNSL